MLARSAVFARVVSFQRAFLAAVAFQHCRIQIQAVAFGPHGHALHLPLGEWGEQALHIAHAESPEEIADRVIARESIQPQQGVQGTIPA